MRKKMLFFVFTFLICFSFLCGVSASNKLYCVYGPTTIGRLEETISFEFSLNGDSAQLSSLVKKTKDIHNGTKSENTYTEQEVEVKLDLNEKSKCPSSIDFKLNSSSEKLYALTSGTTYKKAEKGNSKVETGHSYCVYYNNKTSCQGSESSGKVACLWNTGELNGVNYNYCNFDNLIYVYCGDAKDIPVQAPALISFAVNLLKIATPIILIFVGVVSLLKAIASSNEDEMKKVQKSLIRKIIMAAMVFFVITIVQFVIGKVADNEVSSSVNDKVETANLSDCLDCFLNNNCWSSAYYKANIAGEYYYFDLKTNKMIDIFDK